MTRRLRLGILFGGRSVEHDVSLVSARSVLAAIDPERYEIVPIGVTREGAWLTSPRADGFLDEGVSAASGEPAALLADPSVRGLVRLDRPGGGGALLGGTLDVIFPLIHGVNGEDGKIQGLLDMAGVPYVGSGVLGSALGMDKDVSKRLFRAAGIPVVDSVVIRAHEWRAWIGGEDGTVPAGKPGRNSVSHRSSVIGAVVSAGPGGLDPVSSSSPAGLAALRRRIETEIGYPCFVKPAGQGSSVGVSRARSWDDLRRAVEEALGFDEKVLVERAIDAREIEIAVLGNDAPEASVAGEIVTKHEFYDYEAKYHDDATRLLVPAPISEGLSSRLRGYAIDAFRALELSGMARVDYLVDRRTEEPFLNEVNTIPGFTPVSMYPKLWEASGVSYPVLVDRLIQLAFERHEARTRLRTTRPGPGEGPRPAEPASSSAPTDAPGRTGDA